MKAFSIKGRVVSSQNPKQGINGLRIEIWDRDFIFHDRLGAAITDEAGAFNYHFTDADFRDWFFDRYPDLFFKVYAGETLLKDTRKSTQWNVGLNDAKDIYEMPDIPVDYAVGSVQNTDVQVSEKGSSRSIYLATFTPRKTKAEEANAPGTRGLEKGAFIASLKPSAMEMNALLKKSEGLKRSDLQKKVSEALAIVAGALGNEEKIDVWKNAKQFAGIELPVLWQFADALIAHREKALADMEQALAEMQKAASSKKQVAGNAHDWIRELESKATQFVERMDIRAVEKRLRIDISKITPADFLRIAGAELANVRAGVAQAKDSFKVIPVGYLHLEKMSFTPAGIERGELVYSLPLAPGEEVNITHKEWSRTSEEFERIVTDYMENYSEEGVSEKSEFADAVNAQSQHSTAFNTSVSASGSYAGFSISTSVGYNASDSSSKSQQTSRKQANEITQKASSRVKKEHKVSFKVASAAGTEDQQVRRIVNPFKDRATRVDYYQLIRKWQVNLYRYDMRLTWDLAIPEPGSGLLSKIKEIHEVRRQLENPFEFDLKVQDITVENYTDLAAQYGASISIEPIIEKKPVSEIFIGKWGLEQNVCTDGPPHFFIQLETEVPEDYQITKADIVIFGHRCAETVSGWALDIYDMVANEYIYQINTGGINFRTLVARTNEWSSKKSGKFTIVGRTWRINDISIKIVGEMELTDVRKRAWKLNVWQAIHDSAYSSYNENRQKLKEKLARLEEELGAQDALSLRKKEREEVMKGVLRWMGISGFGFFPHIEFPNAAGEIDIESLYNEDTGTVQISEGDRDLIGRQGEIIKFLHQAIEWENMLYFLYPYFWTHPTRWEFKKYLDHPDPQHKAFLKAGSARVILTIRPGFEHAFLAFKDTGEMEGLPKYPYLSIGEEFRNYAQTNYPGIPPANAVKTYRPQFTFQQVKTWERMELIIYLLNVFFRINRTYPRAGAGWFAELLAIFPMKDPWGRPFYYSSTGAESYELLTYGKNGSQGGNEENTDIRSTDLQTGNYPGSIYAFPTQYQAWKDMNFLMDLLEKYKDRYGRYPNTNEGLAALKDLLENEDAWGNEFSYVCPGQYGEFDLASYGADGQPGGEGDDADIASWAEASLIGQWHEYTPTSAMDIAFDEDFKEKPN